MGEELSLARMMNLYSPKIFRGGMINFSKRGQHALLTSMDDDNDRLPQGSVTVPEEDILADPADAKFLASEGLQKLILDKEKLTSEWDQLLADRDQIAARLPTLEAQAAVAVELEARLQQSEQEVVTLNQEAAQLRVQYQEAKAKWSEVQNDVLAAVDREAASTKRLNNFEATLNSKAEEAVAAEEKHARMEEKYRKVMEHNKVYNSTIRYLDVSFQVARSERNKLSTEVDQLKEELQCREASLIVEKHIPCIA
ncbi:uncharacterized protein [Nicotiana tomentosiformis]|uniref:uncharacterized protein n=1 Tax=Nicotiana tomentosiformis TaxID=4098 RepID=UPI00388C3B94